MLKMGFFNWRPPRKDFFFFFLNSTPKKSLRRKPIIYDTIAFRVCFRVTPVTRINIFLYYFGRHGRESSLYRDKTQVLEEKLMKWVAGPLRKKIFKKYGQSNVN